MAGFEYVYRMCGAGPTIKNVLGPLTALHKGDVVKVTSGSVSLAGTAETTILGVAIADFAGNAGGKSDRLPVIIDPDAIYSVKDANARKIGDKLNPTGATGAQTVASSGSPVTFVVVEDKTATEPTKVRFNVGHHHYNTAV